ncbi:papilin b, proteoglycan-like sulfated glycoprotein [Engraulis encrasicolus]|uniref:papilin b, proteoglycan-like sulfated glycoprotein n=1 Tax=Engraulis encrasicolus TaxID=184585 RepID=UPI002FD48B6D
MMLLPLLGVLPLLFSTALSLTQPTEDRWGEWSAYGPCSRTCGTGVAMRSRTCMTMRTDGGHNCVGASKAYNPCNTRPCPLGGRDFREEQCSRFDHVAFQGKPYSWTPYYGATNPCELVCVPSGENFYYRHRATVVDGTPCYVGRSDICVEGVCRVLTGGEILSLDTDSSSSSRSTSPSRPSQPEPSSPLREQYRYTAPAFSACSVSCGEGVETRTVQCVTAGAGTPRVVADSYCVAQGLRRPHEQQHCRGTGACAEYSVSSFSTCSATCGEGTQRREVVCVGGRGERLPESACAGLPRPEEVRTCTRPSCHQHISYHVADWSLCSVSCGTGRRERRVLCMDQDKFEYPEERCASQFKPYSVESCNTQACPGAQMVPSVQDSRGHDPSLRGFIPYSPEVDRRNGGSPRPTLPFDPRPYEPRPTVPHVPAAECSRSYYGCCPDGVTTPTGPAGLGCECIVSRYGCCPDGNTVARGPRRGEGCPQDDCRRSRYGCCADGRTPAPGPTRGSCPQDDCSISRYGCCSDGHTAATGPRGEGCPRADCSTTTYGCCNDGVTAASGPRGEGCPQDDCVRTRFGCCRDGVTAARGFGYAGCPEYRPTAGPSVDVCSLPREVGPCRDWISRFYFDRTRGVCTHFWYGGCSGNANSFLSMAECQRQCVASSSGGSPAPPPHSPPPAAPAAAPARRPVLRVRTARRYRSSQ